MSINPANIRRQSRVQRVIRFWVRIIVGSLILFLFMFFIGSAFVAINNAMHPVDYNIQLPTLNTY